MKTAALEAGTSCTSIERVADQVRAMDRSFYATVFAREPDIAQCFDGRAAARHRSELRAACIEHRRATMLEAQQIETVAERARLLISLPVCDRAAEP